MFVDLIFAVFSLIGLVVIDKFSTPCGVVTCGFLVYAYYKLRILDRHLIDVFLTAKVLNICSLIFHRAKRVYLVLKKPFSIREPPARDTSRMNGAWHCGDKARLESEIGAIVSNILQNYIHTWYDKISDDEDFISNLNGIIEDFLMALCSAIAKIDAKHFSSIVLQIYLHFFIHFVELTKEIPGKILRENFEMKHWATKDNVVEWCYLESLISMLLDSFGPIQCHSSLHSKSSPLLHNLIVEILTENIMYPFINVMIDPVYLNTFMLKIFTTVLGKDEFTKGVPSLIAQGMENNAALSQDDFTSKLMLLVDNSSSKVLKVDATSISPYSGSCSFNMSNNKLKKESATLMQSLNPEDSSDVPSLYATGRKSTSINILNNGSFLSVKNFDEEYSPAILYDISMIKRSRSADYIRQMPQLKPLNERNYNIIRHSQNNKMLVAIKSDLQPFDAEQAVEAVEIEVPTLFSDVKITETEQKIESSHLPYTLYCIQYTGVFHDTGKCAEIPHFVKLTVNIKRRFREFLALHSRLEDNPVLKSSLKGIKGPTKWLSSPFSNLDKKNVADRKRFLEHYLQELCSQDAIVNSAELQEFLAYGGDASLAFVKKATDMSVPRIDKMLFRGVKGAIDLFRTALPVASSEMCSKETLRTFGTSFDDSYSDYRFPECLLDFSCRKPEIAHNIKSYLKCIDKTSSLGSFNCSSKILEEELFSRKHSLLRNVTNINVGECCKDSETVSLKDGCIHENIFGDIIIDMLAESLKSEMLNIESLISVIKLLCASSINRCLELKLNNISEGLLVNYLHVFHKALWHDKKTEEIYSQHVSNVSEKITECFNEFLATSNYTKNLSSALRNFVLNKMNLFVLSLQHPELNRCLLFYMFDYVIKSLCSKQSKLYEELA